MWLQRSAGHICRILEMFQTTVQPLIEVHSYRGILFRVTCTLRLLSVTGFCSWTVWSYNVLQLCI
jgi:hypothetical protein